MTILTKPNSGAKPIPKSISPASAESGDRTRIIIEQVSFFLVFFIPVK